MPIIDQVKALCDRLGPLGWRDLLLRASSGSLDIRKNTTAELEASLTSDIASVDRTVPGFSDFCPTPPARGICAGSVPRSLLYHALASPLVHPAAGTPATAYPTQEELDIVENYIFALQPVSLGEFLLQNPDAKIVVCATQYRAGGRSPHRRHADMAWSRTGVARTGVTAAVYDPVRRSWLPSQGNGDSRIATMPARYSAWLATPRTARATDVIMDGKQLQRNRVSHWPIRKIFPGSECFTDVADLQLSFAEFHINEKLRSIHREQPEIVAGPGFDLDAAPFVRTSESDPNMVSLVQRGASVELHPRHGPLVNVARQGTKILHFTVPPATNRNRFFTSLNVPARVDSDTREDYRAAPEYVNIRHEYQGDTATPQDLGQLPAGQFTSKLNTGGYPAVHFSDNTGDGAILVKVSGIQSHIPTARQLPAFSLVTAPDFFPLVDQAAIFRWSRNLQHFAQGGPEPLSRGKAPASLDVLRPGTKQKAFRADDKTMTHVAGRVENPGLLMLPELLVSPSDLAVSWLPDGASNVFAPGWDVSKTKKGNSVVYLSSRGLGSPFPEDAKLCAVLNSFWPAVAPDASRTFGRAPNGIPLLDSELGIHPSAGGAADQHGWDGEFGPFFENTAAGKVINAASINRSDYVSNGLAGRIHYAGLDEVTTEDLIARMEALRACIASLPPTTDNVPTSSLVLVSAQRVENWSTRADRLSAQLSGPGYVYVFAESGGPPSAVSGDVSRVRIPIAASGGKPQIFVCHLRSVGSNPDLLVWKREGDTVNVVPLGTVA